MLVHVGFKLRLNRDNRVYSDAEYRMIFFKNLNEYIVSKPRECLCGEKTSNDWKSICTMRVLQTPNHECEWWLVAVCLIFTHSMGLVPGHKSKEMLSFLF